MSLMIISVEELEKPATTSHHTVGHLENEDRREAELQRRIQSMEKRRYRKVLRIPYKAHVINEEVCAKIQQAIGPHEDLLTIVKRRKLRWYGHVFRLSGLAKPSCKAQ